ncbi:DUF4957 domain-containing protein [Desertivirga arenae]|uniref:DUF4957 domain-containing protein n=1 Tax=Desertivirga arenae TaxID=2810309 RepID=UPI001A95A39F|nr:DUF4957 domain-containing protein [Pedobacter sp. SYSU D00823]
MNINKILIGFLFAAGAGAFQGCNDDAMSEITTLQLERALSPTEMTAAVVNKTGVKLTWTPVGTAKYYKAEIFESADFSGSAVKTVDSIAIAKIPYTITGLSGETTYYARVKALGTGNEDSKWVSASFTTDAEQILQDVNPQKMTATTVTINWPAGETATSIVLTPGNITKTVTPAEIAAGEAVVTGLTQGTSYTVKLMNGTKTRGTKSFVAGEIPVSSTQSLATVIASAKDGDVFSLLAGTYAVNGDLAINKSITIKAATSTNKPLITGATIKINANAGLTLKNLVLDGTGSSGDQTIIYNEDQTSAYGALSVQDCELKKYVKGLVYVNKKALIESVVMSGNIIYEIECSGGDFIDFRTGIAKTFLFENNTVYNSCHARDLFRMDVTGATNFNSITSIITIRNNTFNDVANANRFLYIRLTSHQIHFTKNIIANTNGYYTNQASTTITTMASNNYFNAPNFTGSATANAKNDASTTKTLLDPGFTSASTGDFTISNTTLKNGNIGDPRWIK